MRERAELLHGVLRELGHGLGRVGLEHQARGVRRRPAGGEQRSAVDHGDVGPAARGELVCQRRADDSRTDDDDLGDSQVILRLLRSAQRDVFYATHDSPGRAARQQDAPGQNMRIFGVFTAATLPSTTTPTTSCEVSGPA